MICMVVHNNYYYDPRVRRYAESILEQGVAVDVICPPLEYAPVQDRENIRVYMIPIRNTDESQLNYFISYALSFIYYSLWISILFF